ncbi:MAG: DUF4012 domain-containing protein [Candidatus Falkowbacteria bacterium]
MRQKLSRQFTKQTSGPFDWLIELGRLEASLARLLGRLFWRFIYGITLLIESLGRAVAGSMSSIIWILARLVTLPIRLLLAAGAVFSSNLRSAGHAFNRSLTHYHTGLIRQAELTKENIRQQSDSAKTKINHKIKRLSKVRIAPQASFLKPAAVFALILFIVLAPFAGYRNFNFLLGLKDKIISAAHAAIGNMQSAKQAAEGRDLNKAAANFSQAGQDFLQAETDIARINSLLLKLAGALPNSDLKLASSAQNLAAAGRIGSDMAANLAEAINSLLAAGELTDRLDAFNGRAVEASAQARELQQTLSQIKLSDLPDQYRQDFTDLKNTADLVASSLTEIVDLVEDIKIFAGAEQDRRYLLIFQNNAEMRASGGFIGSFALLDLAKGKIKKMETPGGGAYDTEGGMRVRLAAPEPLWLVDSLWHFWDVNWWPDWPRTAKKLSWFYEKSDGSSVDGVIAFTPDTIIALLKLVGPIDLPQYKTTISADNFTDTVQYIAEQKTGATSTPKMIIGDLSGKLIEKLGQNLDRQKLVALLSLVEKSLDQKQVLLYFSDNRLEQKVASLGWDGAIKQTDNDYLMVVNTNIAGGKSDRRMTQIIDHRASVAADGSIIDTLLITREHTGIRNELFSGVRNVDWMRIYVPLGTELISAEGFRIPEAKYFSKASIGTEDDPDLANERQAEVEPATLTKIYREQDKTVFANWLMVDPGEKAQIKLVYRLPFGLRPTDNSSGGLPSEQLYKYTLLMQKQPGANNVAYASSLDLADKGKLIWHYPDSNNSYNTLENDKLNAYLISR